MTRLTILFLACSLIGCGTLQRPNSNLYGVNAPGQKLRGYNLKNDYNDDGTLKPDAKVMEYPLTDLKQLNGWFCTDPVSMKNLKTSAADLRDYISNHCK